MRRCRYWAVRVWADGHETIEEFFETYNGCHKWICSQGWSINDDWKWYVVHMQYEVFEREVEK